jgi:hypothetical protein
MGDRGRPVARVNQVNDGFPNDGKGRCSRLLHSADYCGKLPRLKPKTDDQ